MTPQIRNSWWAGQRKSWLFIAVLLMASRLPLIANGYGSDSDSWRNIVAALRMREIGHYVPSRVPGFPVFEYLLVLLAPGGWIVTNLAAIAAGLIAAVIFAFLLLQLKIQNPLWPWLAFAFGTPLAVITSQTMDYSFGLAFFLACYLAMLRRHYLTAGVLLALATGCRFTYILVNVSVLVFLMARRENWRRYLAFAAGYISIATILFVPVITSPEVQGLDKHFLKHAGKCVRFFNLYALIRIPVIFLFGKFGAIVVAFGLAAVSLKNLRISFGKFKDWIFSIIASREVFLFEITTIFSVVVFYVLIPYQSAYLLPLVPIVLIILARMLPRPWLIAVAVAIVIELFVSVQFDKRRVVEGNIVREIDARQKDMSDTRALLARNPVRPTVYVVSRFMVRRLLVMAPDMERTPAGWAPFGSPGVALRSRDGRMGFAATLQPDDRERLTGDGWNIRELPY